MRNTILMAILTITLLGSVEVEAQRQLAVRDVSSLSNGIVSDTYRLSTSKEVVMNLSGTTPVKDWSMTANGLSGSAVIRVTSEGSIESVGSLTFKLPVQNLKGEVKAMDEDAYEALKADRHKDITFRLISSSIEPQDGNNMLAAKGKLTVAGVTRVVTLRMIAKAHRDGSVSFTGSQHLRMSDYDVERPSLLFGAIKASNEMTLTYKLVFTR